jgi:uncharacterized repeat protein (TIGR03943 family)
MVNPFTGADGGRGSASAGETGPAEINIRTLFEERPEYLGKTVEVVGMAESFPELGEDKLFLYRFTVWCCAADARPLGLIVLWDDVSSIQSNAWYRVKGEVAMVTVESESEEEFLGLRAEAVVPTGEPEVPFLF